MISVLWKYKVKPQYRRDFLAAYGADGRWVAFFKQDAGYRETILLQPTDGHFLTIDRWCSREAYDAFRVSHAEEYKRLDRSFDCFFEEEEDLGICEEI